MTVADQPTVSYTYDAAHRLTQIAQDTTVVTFAYDDADRRSTLTYPNGIVATYGYDAANQLTSLSYALGQTTLGDLTYAYDVAGRRTSVGGSWARTGIPAAMSGAMYDAANRIVTWNGTSFGYDLNGNLASDGLTSYVWNARNQLTGLSGGVSASFAYDGVGRRRGKTVNGTSTNFLYDGLNPVQELSGSTPTANLLIGLGIDEILARTDGSGTSTLLTDTMGSTLEVADASGTLQTHYTYEPFGATTVRGAASTNSLQFSSRENDGLDLYYFRSRYLSTTSLRFISEDPLGRGGRDVNFYEYVHDNPLAWVDPFGLSACPTDSNHVTDKFGSPRATGPHDGVDFRNRLGMPVYATEDGWVNDIFDSRRGGHQIVIFNDNGSVSGDAHTLPIVVPGQRVREGDIIGWSDGSGHVIPHLHHTYYPYPGGDRENPLPHLPAFCAGDIPAGGRKDTK